LNEAIRGKYGSEGGYVMTRPPMGPLNPSKTDDTTDAWDTIDWLVKNVTESNERVGMIGSSYDGWTVTMALLDPHPALKVAAPESPMIDGWMGDDWFHYGAFRQINLDYFTGQSSNTGAGATVPRWSADDYQNFLDAGTAGNWANKSGFEQLPFWNRLSAHPAYDAFWQGQALDAMVAAHPASITASPSNRQPPTHQPPVRTATIPIRPSRCPFSRRRSRSTITRVGPPGSCRTSASSPPARMCFLTRHPC
jgi:predicted acyl esterase